MGEEQIDPLLKKAIESGKPSDALILLAKRTHDLKKEVSVLIGEMRIDLDNLASVDHVEDAISRFGKKLRRRGRFLLAVVIILTMAFYSSYRNAQHLDCADRNHIRAAIIDGNNINNSKILSKSTADWLKSERC